MARGQGDGSPPSPVLADVDSQPSLVHLSLGVLAPQAAWELYLTLLCLCSLVPILRTPLRGFGEWETRM